MATDIFAVRDVDDSTREFITNYAKKHRINMAQALREIVLKSKENRSSKGKKYKSLFDTYEKIKISGGDPKLSEKIDDVLYGEDL
ncbi:hypothetical protein J4216_02080 [Candidatus Woesearchaeota archaeon]|nr:hypothetical protein [Candidatus Woesearchaeota archaeon]